MLKYKIVRRFLYLHYVIKYYITHEKGNYPACYNEWIDNEFAEGFYW